MIFEEKAEPNQGVEPASVCSQAQRCTARPNWLASARSIRTLPPPVLLPGDLSRSAPCCPTDDEAFVLCPACPQTLTPDSCPEAGRPAVPRPLNSESCCRHSVFPSQLNWSPHLFLVRRIVGGVRIVIG